MKITKQQLIEMIKEEVAKTKKHPSWLRPMKEQDGQETMSALQDLPDAADDIADEVVDFIEDETEKSSIGPEALAAMVADLILSKVK